MTEVGGFHHEWFNNTLIPEEKINDCYIIYIYRDPIHSIYSRFEPNHLYNIQSHTSITYEDIYNTNKDLYKIEEFFDNYTTPNKDRNYKIICLTLTASSIISSFLIKSNILLFLQAVINKIFIKLSILGKYNQLYKYLIGYCLFKYIIL